MKKIFLIASLALMSASLMAQSEKYQKAMQEKVAAVDTTFTPDGLKALSNTFERIADAEKNQWLPYYYAALTQINSGYMMMVKGGNDLAPVLDPVADKAEGLISKAEALSSNNSEIYLVKKMIATLRMSADPMNRYMQYGPQAQQALETAKKLNPENPRVYLLEGQDKFYTPEQYGGSKTEAKKLFEEALKKYDSFKPATSIDPNWGRGTTNYFLGQIK
ncbi:MAG TPA: hypothetical protein VHK91_07950 [Flavisolibacter sp.]|jgi:hypothetical protein|nr:hypothetical protein [Flavisolibacter sp.]